MKYLNFHKIFFLLLKRLFNVNDKATAWHTPSFKKKYFNNFVILKIWPAKLVKFRLAKKTNFPKISVERKRQKNLSNKNSMHRTGHSRQSDVLVMEPGGPNNNNNNREQEDRNFKYLFMKLLSRHRQGLWKHISGPFGFQSLITKCTRSVRENLKSENKLFTHWTISSLLKKN